MLTFKINHYFCQDALWFSVSDYIYIYIPQILTFAYFTFIVD